MKAKTLSKMKVNRFKLSAFLFLLFGLTQAFSQDIINGGNPIDQDVIIGRKSGLEGKLFFINSNGTNNMVLTYDPSYLGLGVMTPESDLHIHSDVTFIPGSDGGVEGGDQNITTKGLVMPKLTSESVIRLTNHYTGITDNDGFLIKSYGSDAILTNKEDGHLKLYNNGTTLNLDKTGEVFIQQGSEKPFVVKANGDIQIANHLTTQGLTTSSFEMNLNNSTAVYSVTAGGGNVATDWNRIESLKISNSNNALVFYAGGTFNERVSFIQSGHNDGVYSDVGGVLALNPFGGNVGVGIVNPQHALDVKGSMRACKLIANNLDGWCDYVFEEDYELMPLDSLSIFVKEYKHLPEIPTEDEVAENGIDVGEMNKLLLKKVEELSLYIIEQEKRITNLENRLK